jgi:Sec1 family
MKENDVYEKTHEDDDVLIVLFDRITDLSPMLVHSWHYGSLMADVLQISNNKVVLRDEVRKTSNPFWFSGFIL